MNGTPAVLVKKGGFFSALFWFLAIVVLVIGALGLFGLYVVHSTAGGVLQTIGAVAANAQHLPEVLPPLVAEALNDRRDPAYRDQLDVSVELVPAPEHGKQAVVVQVVNRGPRTVSTLALLVTVETANGIPFAEEEVYAATPFAIPDEGWRGPLMPGSQRRFLVDGVDDDGEFTARVEITELRVWSEDQAPPAPHPAADDHGDRPHSDADHQS